MHRAAIGKLLTGGCLDLIATQVFAQLQISYITTWMRSLSQCQETFFLINISPLEGTSEWRPLIDVTSFFLSMHHAVKAVFLGMFMVSLPSSADLSFL